MNIDEALITCFLPLAFAFGSGKNVSAESNSVNQSKADLNEKNDYMYEVIDKT